MRDLLITLIVMGSLPIVFTRPHVGILLWAWISYMNPHRLSYGFAFSFPFAMLIALVTLTALLTASRERRPIPMGPLTYLLILWVVWMNITSLFALVPEEVGTAYSKNMKIHLMNFVTMMVVWGKEKIIQLGWVIGVSIIFFGTKGGFFTIASGGGALVWGPPGSEIAGNNELALAIIVTIPLFFFLITQVEKKWIRWIMLGCIGLSVMSVIGTFSRGAFLAILAMGFFLWMKSEKKWIAIVAVAIILPLGAAFMPSSISDRYSKRMDTIENYEEDGSAMGRINAWWFAFNLAVDHPIMGGGYNTFHPRLFHSYAPEPEDFHDAHSIYFEVLGEQGFVGLAIFLAMPLATWLYCAWIRRRAEEHEDLKWAHTLASMVQVSVIGFGVGGDRKSVV